MRHSIKKDDNKRTAIAFVALSGLLGLSLIATTASTVMAMKFHDTQVRLVVPMGFNQSFSSTKNGGDSNLNSMLVRALINLRLSVTPETIDQQQKEILSYTSPNDRPKLKLVLDEEANYIKKNDVSAQFIIEGFDYDAKTGDTIVSGQQIAATTGGTLRIPDSHKQYIVNVAYIDGMVKLNNFTEVVPN
jgi:conjugal transfer pilus assembly protein TraE